MSATPIRQTGTDGMPDVAARPSVRAETCPILMYHQIRALPAKTDVLRSLSVAPHAFRRQMRLLKALGYRGVSVAELQQRWLREPRARLFGITFDDGFRNVIEHAMPVLGELGFTATCYFVSGKLGGSNDWDRDLATREAALMDRDAMLEWLAHGHEVGAHTIDHVALPDVPASDAWRQISHSKQQLEVVTGRPVVSFCYPYGSWNANVRRLVVDAGFRNATTTVRGHASERDDPFQLPRIAVSGERGLVRFLGRFFR